MLEKLTKISSNGFVLAIISALATVVSSYFYFNPEQKETIEAIITLVIYFIILGFFISKRLSSSFKTDVTNDKIHRLNILLLYSEKENDTDLINSMVGKYSNSVLNFSLFKVNMKGENILANLKSDLKNVDGIYCFWNNEISNNYVEYISIIEDWLLRYEDKPFIIVGDETTFNEEIKNSYRVIDKEGAENSLPTLLSRSISRTKRFVKDVTTWKLAFYFSSFVLASLLSISLFFYSKEIANNKEVTDNEEIVNNKDTVVYDELPFDQAKSLSNKLRLLLSAETEIPKDEIKEYVDEYFELKQKQLSHLLNDDTIEVSLWRTDTLSNIIHRITRSNSPTKTLPLESVAGCSCEVNKNDDKLIVGWKFEDGKNVQNFWGMQTGKIENNNKPISNCQYLELPNEKKAIISVATKLSPTKQFNIICVNSKNNSHIITDENANNSVKSIMLELVNLTSLIPDKAFKK